MEFKIHTTYYILHTTFVNSGAFLQSPEWEKFQESLGRKTWRIDGAFVVKMDFCLGLYFLYSPKINEKLRITNYELRIKELAKKERAIFWRVEPSEQPPKEFIKTKDRQPLCTLITDISKPEEGLLSAMHPKTRYNIRLAEKKQLRITNYELRIADKNFNEFYNLLQKTSSRQNIKLHSKEYYKKLAEFNEIFIAYHKNTPVACAMVNFYQDTATYLHGGSDEKYKSQMAPYLLHWEIIKAAKSHPVRGGASNGARGFHFYDWWGVDEQKWPGLTRFKLGFGGEKVCAPGAFDLPINKTLYFIYKLFKE